MRIKNFINLLASSALLIAALTTCREQEELPYPQAGFEIYSENGIEGTGIAYLYEQIYFNNQSTNAENFSWNFGDNTYSDEQHPEHSYSETGNFTIELVAINREKVNKYQFSITVIDEESAFYITTKAISNITTNSASSGGIIINNTDSYASDRGVCWSTTTNPETDDAVVYDYNYSDDFTSELTNLIPNTKYYLRAFAQYDGELKYGNEVIFTTEEIQANEPGTAKIYRTQEAPIIDGEIDWFWNMVSPQKIFLKKYGTEEVSFNDTATWKAVWDDNAIYILIEVPDDDFYPNSESGLETYESDKPEIYFDVIDPKIDGGAPGLGTYGHYQFAPSITELSSSRFIAAYHFYDATQETAGSYAVEYKIPFYSIRYDGYEDDSPTGTQIFDPLTTSEIGFDITIIDLDEIGKGLTTGSRQRTSWVNQNTDSWENLDESGNLIFVNSQELNADFYVDETEVNVNELVYFYDNSIPYYSYSSWLWDFGDGEGSNQQYPNHTYTTAGKYTVSLTISNGIDADTETKTDFITIINPNNPPVADFTADTYEVQEDETVTFTDLSSNAPTGWFWEFGDGQTSYEQNPTHSYSTQGTYNVALTAYNGAGDNYKIEYDYITVIQEFNYGNMSDNEGNNYKTIQIDDQNWMAENLKVTKDYDGVAFSQVTVDSDWSNLASTDEAAYCHYDNNTSNDVLYTMAAARKSCPTGWHLPSDDDWKELETYAYNNGQAGSEGDAIKSTTGWDNSNGTNNFGFSALGVGHRALSGYFTGETFNAYWWTTGSTNSVEISHNNTAMNYGNWVDHAGFSVRCIEDETTGTRPDGQFTADSFNITLGSTIQFYDNSSNTPTSWIWEFGDGNISYEQNPTHTYTTTGAFTVKLNATNSYGRMTNTWQNCITVTSNSAGIVEDTEGNTYNTIKIGTQWWMAENLRVTASQDGTLIPYITTDSIWANLGDNNDDAAYTYYNNNLDEKHGALYTYAAALNACPTGWRLPSDADWTTLENSLITDGYTTNTAAQPLKATTGWNDYNGTDTYGFNATASGFRSGSGGESYNFGTSLMMWSSDEYDSEYAYRCYMTSNGHSIQRDQGGGTGYSKSYGFSVRCLKE